MKCINRCGRNFIVKAILSFVETMIHVICSVVIRAIAPTPVHQDQTGYQHNFTRYVRTYIKYIPPTMKLNFSYIVIDYMHALSQTCFL